MTQNKKSLEIEEKVLFQKLGDKWYLFTHINNEFIYSALPDGMDPRTTKFELIEVLEEHVKKISNKYQNNPMAA